MSKVPWSEKACLGEVCCTVANEVQKVLVAVGKIKVGPAAISDPSPPDLQGLSRRYLGTLVLLAASRNSALWGILAPEFFSRTYGNRPNSYVLINDLLIHSARARRQRRKYGQVFKG